MKCHEDGLINGSDASVTVGECFSTILDRHVSVRMQTRYCTNDGFEEEEEEEQLHHLKVQMIVQRTARIKGRGTRWARIPAGHVLLDGHGMSAAPAHDGLRASPLAPRPYGG